MSATKQRRFVRMFQPRFARLVEAGTKRQTVRKTPKRMPEVGDIIDCREWIGKPYQSKQRKLCEGQITRVNKVTIRLGELKLGDKWQSDLWADLFAKSDGFSGFPEMLHWLDENHGLPFEGIVIHWEVMR